jgi:hypothetical protein
MGKKRQAPLTVEERERDVHTNRIEQRREVPDEPDGMYFFPLLFCLGRKIKRRIRGGNLLMWQLLSKD